MPRPIAILFFLSFSFHFCFGQISISTDSIYVESTANNPGFGNILLYNDYDEPKTIIWERDIICITEPWESYVMDENIAYAPPVGTYQLSIEPGDSTPLFVFILDQQMEGQAIIDLKLNVEGSDDSLATPRFYFNTTSCLTSTNDLAISNAIQFWPNPSRQYLSIESPIPTKVTIRNSLGQVVKYLFIREFESIDISTLRNGFFNLQFFDDEGNHLITRKFLKQ